MRILVAGIGNIFFGDDAFGVETVREFMQHGPPPEVRVEDFGIRSYDLAYAMMDNYDATILVDATPRGKPAGTLCLMELDPAQAESGQTADAHSMDPVAVLGMVKTMGGEPSKRLYLVGCEPAMIEPDDCEFGLSEAVRDAVPHAVEMIESLVTDLLRENPVQAKGGEKSDLLQ